MCILWADCWFPYSWWDFQSTVAGAATNCLCCNLIISQWCLSNMQVKNCRWALTAQFNSVQFGSRKDVPTQESLNVLKTVSQNFFQCCLWKQQYTPHTISFIHLLVVVALFVVPTEKFPHVKFAFLEESQLPPSRVPVWVWRSSRCIPPWCCEGATLTLPPPLPCAQSAPTPLLPWTGDGLTRWQGHRCVPWSRCSHPCLCEHLRSQK